jgi:hypothetical protein
VHHDAGIPSFLEHHMGVRKVVFMEYIPAL